MNLLQIASAILFFYVFGMGAVLITYYAVKIIAQLIQESRKQQKKKPPPDVAQESVKLHISEGLIQVNRLPEEQGNVERDNQ